MAQIEMLAAVCTSPGEGDALELRRVRVDDPHEMEVRVKLETTGICRSDIHYLRGVWAHPKPVILGHEGWHHRIRRTWRAEVEDWREGRSDLHPVMRPLPLLCRRTGCPLRGSGSCCGSGHHVGQHHPLL